MAYTYKYPRPALTVDALVFAGSKKTIWSVLLIQRRNEPFKGRWALPGGFVDMDEDLETAAIRELEEETSLKMSEMQQFKAYGAVDRDPRHRTVSVVFSAFIEQEKDVHGLDDAAKAAWFPLNNLPELAFDHAKILSEAKMHYNLSSKEQ